MNHEHAMWAALDALGVGNQDEAAEILLEALEGPTALPPICGVCNQRAWPGDTLRHIYSKHNPATLARAA